VALHAALLAPEPFYPHTLRYLAAIAVLVVVVAGWLLGGPGRRGVPFWSDVRALQLWAGFAVVLILVWTGVVPEMEEPDGSLWAWGATRWLLVAGLFLVFDLVGGVAVGRSWTRLRWPALGLTVLWGPGMAMATVDALTWTRPHPPEGVECGGGAERAYVVMMRKGLLKPVR